MDAKHMIIETVLNMTTESPDFRPLSDCKLYTFTMNMKMTKQKKDISLKRMRSKNSGKTIYKKVNISVVKNMSNTKYIRYAV